MITEETAIKIAKGMKRLADIHDTQADMKRFNIAELRVDLLTKSNRIGLSKEQAESFLDALEEDEKTLLDELNTLAVQEAQENPA